VSQQNFFVKDGVKLVDFAVVTVADLPDTVAMLHQPPKKLYFPTDVYLVPLEKNFGRMARVCGAWLAPQGVTHFWTAYLMFEGINVNSAGINQRCWVRVGFFKYFAFLTELAFALHYRNRASNGVSPLSRFRWWGFTSRRNVVNQKVGVKQAFRTAPP
jgi:hypothetical protein